MVRTVEFYRRIVEAVGPRKIMWGSDFIGPSSDLTTWRLIKEQCQFLSESEKELMLSGNALRFVQGEI
jgi:predicted TIM-barrel fold metal-dependent hydrolase